MGRADFDLWKPADSIAAPNTHVCVLASRSRVRRAGCVHVYAPDRISSQKEFCLSPGRREASNNALAPHHHEDFKSRSTSRHSTGRETAGRVLQGAKSKPLLRACSRSGPVAALQTKCHASAERCGLRPPQDSQQVECCYLPAYKRTPSQTQTHTQVILYRYIHADKYVNLFVIHTQPSLPLSPVIYSTCTLPMVSTYSQLLFQSQTARHASFFGNHVPGISLM